MNEETQPRTGGAAEFSQDRLANQNNATDIPAIPPEIVGNTTDIVSRDWTGVGGEAADLDDEEGDEASASPTED